jgi:hypothetical protein
MRALVGGKAKNGVFDIEGLLNRNAVAHFEERVASEGEELLGGRVECAHTNRKGSAFIIIRN